MDPEVGYSGLRSKKITKTCFCIFTGHPQNFEEWIYLGDETLKKLSCCIKMQSFWDFYIWGGEVRMDLRLVACGVVKNGKTQLFEVSEKCQNWSCLRRDPTRLCVKWQQLSLAQTGFILKYLLKKTVRWFYEIFLFFTNHKKDLHNRKIELN